MLSPRDKALKALAVYLQRGYEAQEARNQRGTEAFLELMAAREAAFHNFRYFEDQAQRAGHGLANDPQAHRLMALLAPQNEALSSLVAADLQEIASQLSRTNAARNATSAYHSGRSLAPKYLKQT